MDAPKRPDKEITLPESGIVVKMTYVVFNDILRFVGTIDEALSSILTNQETRDLIIRRCLTDSGKPIENMEDLISPNDVEIDIFEMDDLLGWVMEHVAYFFMRTATSMQTRVGRFPELAKRMTSSDPSETGSEP